MPGFHSNARNARKRWNGHVAYIAWNEKNVKITQSTLWTHWKQAMHTSAVLYSYWLPACVPCVKNRNNSIIAFCYARAACVTCVTCALRTFYFACVLFCICKALRALRALLRLNGNQTKDSIVRNFSAQKISFKMPWIVYIPNTYRTKGIMEKLVEQSRVRQFQSEG